MEYSRRTAMVNSPGKLPAENRGVDRKLRNLETKVNLLLVMVGGLFAMTVLTLIALVLK